MVDELAGGFNAMDRPLPTSPLILPPLYEAELILENQMIA
jgi:hypothetical protein